MSTIEERVQILSDKYCNLYSATFELLTVCNWRCKHCYIASHKNIGLPFESVVDILHQLRGQGVYEVTLTGGEIFCRPDIFQIIEEARKLWLKVILFTNVSLLNEEKVLLLKKLGVAEISCTIFSLNPDIHDSISGTPGSLMAALNSLEIIRKHQIPVNVKMIVTNLNCHEISTLAEYCKERGFLFSIDFDIFAKTNGDTSSHFLRMTPQQFESQIKVLDSYRGFTPREHRSNEHVCPGIRCAIAIAHDGSVYPCNKFLVKLGNLTVQSLSDIWDNSNLLKEYQNMQWKDLKDCSHCDMQNFCMHCPGTALLEDGDVYGKCSASCEIAKIRKKVYGVNLL